MSAQYENVSQAAKENRVAVEEEQKAKEVLLKKLAEATGKLEKIKFEHDQILLDKSNIENQVEELQKLHEETSGFDAKLQENLAVIENLESELMKAQDHIKYVEEKLFISEERRLSLESKNEEMCRKITEDSQNLTTIDDLANRVDELLKSEKSLKDSVNVQEAKNVKLKQELDEAELKKQKLDNEVKTLTEKIMEMTAELKQAKDTDVEKVGIINALTNDIEKLKGENKQILVEFDKLNRDYEQFEVDFKENLENSQNIEKSLKHKIEELTNENAAILEKLNLLSEDKTRNDEKTEEEVEDKKPKKRKSGTLRSDEVDLKKQLNLYNGKLKQANAEIENLKAELLREKLKSEMVSMVKEAEGKAESLKLITEEFTKEPLIQKTEVKSLSEKKPKEEERKFDASIFFGAGSGTRVEESTFFDDAVKIQPEGQPQTSDFESLMWDDGWGTDGQLEEEYMSTKVVEITAEPENHYKKQIKLLENEIESMKGELEKMSKELQEQTAKYTKALKKLKEQKIICEKLQSEVSKFKNNEGFGDLNAAIVDELKSQIENMEKKERELLKNIDNFKAEKESLLKRIDVLNAGNEKFLQMKERQDNDAELWQRKNNELLIEITTLRQQLAEPQILDDNALAQENRELLNKVEALEWKNCELTQLLEEKEELLEAREEASSTDVEKTTKEKSLLQKDIEELNKTIEFLKTKLSDEEKNSSATISSLNEQLTALAAENETFQEILNKMKSANASKKTNDADANFLNQKVKELEELSRVKDAEINQLQNLISENQNELDGQKEKLLQLQTEKEIETNTYKQRLLEVESVLRSKEEEMQHFVQQHQARESEILKKKATEEENSKTLVLNQFESIDLNQTVETLPYSENVGTESDALRQRVLELEELIRLKDEEMQRAQSNFVQYGNQEMDDLRQRNYQLQDFLRLKEEELGQLRTMAWNQDNANEMEQLRRQVQDLEEFLRFKENELFQVQALKSNEIQDLNLRIMDLENLLKAGDVSQNESLQQRIFELENLIRLTEEESHRIQSEKTSESENLRQKVQELENLLVCKDEEIKKLVTRLNDLEKSYNDSKIEIERLLNEEKLNAEEKFVEPFQKNIQIPVAFELEAISRSLDEEKQKAVNLQYELVDRDNIIEQKTAEIEYLRKKIADLELQLNNLCDVESSQKVIMDESYEMKAQLEKIITDLQKDLESSNLQLSETKRELEQLKNSKNEVMSNLKMQLNELETELVESTEKKDSEIMELKSELNEKTNFYESLLQSKREEEAAVMDKMKEEEKFKMESEKEVERLRSELSIKEEDILRLSEMLKDYESNSFQMREIINEKERELLDLRQTLIDVQEEIGHFRNFEKQVKELRVAQLKEAGSEVPGRCATKKFFKFFFIIIFLNNLCCFVSVTDEGDPDLSDWTEHELVELSTRLQSDLDTALYMLHQRDVRCDELTFELMQVSGDRRPEEAGKTSSFDQN